MVAPLNTRTNTVVVETPPTHEEIAFRISTHREAVTKELKRLEKEGIITWNRSIHQINDLHRLRKIVTPPPSRH
ncbi:MAG: winged helix-turn-helix domain-containing protein [Gammaproteobacteria bacterium]|nr:winged helix-turn-helix domain-containing protein [Gammaproteobacteria bacterium]